MSARMSWETMRARLHAVPGYGGDRNKARRKEWIWRRLGFTAAPGNLWMAYHGAGDDEISQVELALLELERSAS